MTHSYWDTVRSGRSTSAGGTGKTTVQLQSPTSYTSTAGNTSAIYSAWNVDVDGVPGNDDPWTFGASNQYPVLKYAGMDTTTQFAAQPPPPTVNLDIDADGTADLTDAIMVILYLFGLENEGITNYILFSQQAQRTDPEAVTAYIKTLITTGRIDIDADGTVDLTDIIMVILYLFVWKMRGSPTISCSHSKPRAQTLKKSPPISQAFSLTAGLIAREGRGVIPAAIDFRAGCEDRHGAGPYGKLAGGWNGWIRRWLGRDGVMPDGASALDTKSPSSQ